MTFFATLLLLAVAVVFVALPDGASAQGGERPRYNTPKHDRSVSHRQNFCGRQSNFSAAGENDLRRALSGLDLTVYLVDYAGTEEEYLFAMSPEGGIRNDYPGLFVVLLDELSRRAGFRWRDTYGATRPLNPEEDGNRTWADLLKWSVDTYDLSQEYWSKTPDRMARGISFPEGWFDSSIVLVDLARSSPSSSKKTFAAFNFLQPFELGVWGLIVAAIIFTGLMYWLLERMDGHSDARNLDSLPGGAVFLSAIGFTSHFEFRPNTHAARILSWSWTFWAVIVGSAYTANLASFLVTRQTPSLGVRSMEQAVRTKAPICVQRGAAQDAHVAKYHPRANLIHYQTEEGTFEGLFKGDCDAVLTIMSTFQRYKRRSEMNGNCALRWTGKAVRVASAGFATAVDTDNMCTSLVSHVVDLHMIEMKADGFIDQAWEGYYNWATDQACSAKEPLDDGGGSDLNEGARLGVSEMGGIFLFHGALSAISLLIAAFQYYRKRTVSKKSDVALAEKGDEGVSDDEDEDDVFVDNGDAGKNIAECRDGSIKLETAKKRKNSIWVKQPGHLEKEMWNSGHRASMWEKPKQQFQEHKSLSPSFRSRHAHKSLPPSSRSRHAATTDEGLE